MSRGLNGIPCNPESKPDQPLKTPSRRLPPSKPDQPLKTPSRRLSPSKPDQPLKTPSRRLPPPLKTPSRRLPPSKPDQPLKTPSVAQDEAAASYNDAQTLPPVRLFWMPLPEANLDRLTHVILYYITLYIYLHIYNIVASTAIKPLLCELYLLSCRVWTNH
ncbi:hypothetical protein QE152_g5723 [Popillia japonica]|uniref:Uncharacterized protein n=1 Tax=Popillia japonica TaxID=7064 RepID=A0AAW1MH39_POPJA